MRVQLKNAGFCRQGLPDTIQWECAPYIFSTFFNFFLFKNQTTFEAKLRKNESLSMFCFEDKSIPRDDL